MSREAILYRAHAWSPVLQREITRLQTEAPGRDCWIVSYLKALAPDFTCAECPSRLYRAADLAALPYKEKLARTDWLDSTGSNDLPALAFYREHPDYDFYWFVEYDVRYSGDWGQLFAELSRSQADLLGTTIQDHDENPSWFFWPGLVDAPSVTLQRLRAFLPFHRISNRAMAAVDRWYTEGGAGHQEAVWPSVCKTTGLILEDIGGFGRYTPAAWRGKHYSNTPMDRHLFPGSFIFRPDIPDVFVTMRRKPRYAPLLFHPVKG